MSMSDIRRIYTYDQKYPELLIGQWSCHCASLIGIFISKTVRSPFWNKKFFLYDQNVFLMTGLDSISFFKTTKKFLRLNKLYDNPIAEILLESSSMPSNYTPLGHKATVKQRFLNHIFNITILNHVTARNYNFIETLIYQ